MINANKIDWKFFAVITIFFFAVLINPRDFPFNHFPFIYIAFIIFIFFYGIGNVLEGFKRTKFLSLILFSIWFYYRIIIGPLDGQNITMDNFAYLLEPLLIFGVTGVTGLKPIWTKTAIWAFIFVVAFSAVCGLWILIVGEPVNSWRTTLHTSTGGNIFEGTVLREKDLAIDRLINLVRNSGLSFAVFTFSYQLAIALTLSIGLLFFTKKRMTKYLLILTSLILLAGVITNTERATVVSTFSGIILLLFLRKEKTLTPKFMFSLFIIGSLVWSFISYSYSNWGGNTMLDRGLGKSKTILRLYMVIPTMASIIYEPFGSVHSDYYEEVAREVGWVDGYGRAVSAHNHFANLMKDNGVFGIFIVSFFFIKFWLKLKYVKLLSYNTDWILLATGCVAGIIHSTMHNAGFFIGGYETNILFGMLWAVTPSFSYYNSKVNGDNIEVL